MTKMAAKWLKSIPCLRPKRLKNKPFGAAHTHIAHITEYPSPPGVYQWMEACSFSMQTELTISKEKEEPLPSEF